MKRLYILRHAPAGKRDPERWPNDDDRPVSQPGRRKMQAAARGIEKLGIEPRLILTSPLARARQTARLLAMALGPSASCSQVDWLRPETRETETVRRLHEATNGDMVLVGHEPHLTGLMAVLMSPGPDGVRISLKKGGFCRIDFEDEIRPGAGSLIYLLTPRILRRLAPKI